MSSKFDDQTIIDYSNWLVWVLFPVIETEDPDLKYYYDFEQSQEEYRQVFESLGIDWRWQEVRLDQIETLIPSIPAQSFGKLPIVLNLCDGDETMGIPGITVIHLLEKKKIVYTGSDGAFYEHTTSKIPMKKMFDEHGVATARWCEIDPDNFQSDLVFNVLNPPLIVKPAVSAGSLGLGIKSVVNNQLEFNEFMKSNHRHYKHWDLYQGGVFAEEFINGPEYTTFLVGSHRNIDQCKVYPAVERKFESSLPDQQKFLSFDRLWEFYEHESPLDNNKDLWTYQSVSSEVQFELESLSLKAYSAVGGEGYARIDFRKDSDTGSIKVLEVNSQCGLSADENYTSIGAILRIYDIPYEQLIMDILLQALSKRSVF